MSPFPIFPTALHQQTAEFAHDFFLSQPQVDTVLVVNSCARGQATPESDLDMAVLVKPETAHPEIQELEVKWQSALQASPVFQQFKVSHTFMQLHLDVITGQYTPTTWDDGGGPDGFELEVGNQVAYGAPMHEAGAFYKQLQSTWLPYYDPQLQTQRLAMARQACAYDLDHVPFFFRRGLHFQAFDRLYKAFQEFLQTLFISRKTYPIAYNKWIREQVEQKLGLPGLYSELPSIISVGNIESEEVIQKSLKLKSLLAEWTTD